MLLCKNRIDFCLALNSSVNLKLTLRGMMPLQKENFIVTQNDLVKAVDVDDSAGRSCPINMNFVENGFCIF